MSGAVHGSLDLPGVHVDGYNAELREQGGGFVGDRASNRAFHSLLDLLSDRFAGDPAGPGKVEKEQLDAMLRDGAPEAGGVIVGAIEHWSRQFAGVIQQFLRLPEWQETERITVGGGLRGTRVGELAIGRTVVLLRGEGIDIDLVPISNEPDKAGLIGAAALFPPAQRDRGDAMLVVDVGGTKMRAGLVTFGASPDLRDADAAAIAIWQHGDEEPTRDEAVRRLIDLLRQVAAQADERRLRLVPLIGIGCPGSIRADGSIERGGQNLPGDWEDRRFNLPREVSAAMPGGPWHVLLHNDGVVQGLSEASRMHDVRRWGVMTVGTGLGNARFTNAQ